MSLGNESDTAEPESPPPFAPEPPYTTQRPALGGQMSQQPTSQMPTWQAIPRTDQPTSPPVAPYSNGGHWAPPPVSPPTPPPPGPPYSGGGYPFGYGPQPYPVPQPAPPAPRKTFGRAAVATLMVFTAIIAILGGIVLGSSFSPDTSSITDRAGGAGSVTIPTVPNNGGSSNSGGAFGNGGTSSSGNADQGTQNNGTSSTLSTAAARVMPGVVNINTRLGYQQAMAAGTGMVISSSGAVLTNNHVVEGATEIQATVVGTGKTYTAKVVGTAPSEDVAVIQLEDASGLKTVDLGNSDAVKVGDPIVALGNAGGKGGTPTRADGAVVALDQSITAGDASGQRTEQLEDLIQVDAAIQSGQSGGPLINEQGQVVGMNTAASISRWTGSSPQGFAIPINKAQLFVKDILAGNDTDIVNIGVPGILGVEVADAEASPFGGSNVDGAAVGGVASGSPAEEAGIAAGDVITAVDGTSISSAEALTRTMSGRKPGAKVAITWVDQSGETHEETVTLAEGPAD